MLNNPHKRQNPDTKDDDKKQEPPAIPPMRTFILRQFNPQTGQLDSRTIEAHLLLLDEECMLSFVVVFPHDGHIVQSPKLFVNADAWYDVEEVNVEFPETVTH